jgi:hypothetical protein
MVKDYMSIKFLQLFKLIPVFVALAFMLTITWKGNEVKQKVNHSNMLPVAEKSKLQFKEGEEPKVL